MRSTRRGSVRVRSSATDSRRSAIASRVVVHTLETTSSVLSRSSWRIVGCWEPSGLRASRTVWATWRRSPESASTSASSHSTPSVERADGVKAIVTRVSWHRFGPTWEKRAKTWDLRWCHDRCPHPPRPRRGRRNDPPTAPGVLTGGPLAPSRPRPGVLAARPDRTRGLVGGAPGRGGGGHGPGRGRGGGAGAGPGAPPALRARGGARAGNGGEPPADLHRGRPLPSVGGRRRRGGPGLLPRARLRVGRGRPPPGGRPRAPADDPLEGLDDDDALLARHAGEDDRRLGLPLQVQLGSKLFGGDGGAALLDRHAPDIARARKSGV